MNNKNLLGTISNKPIVIFGASIAGQRIFASLKKLGIEPICFCDNYKTGEIPNAHTPIISPEQLIKEHSDAIVIVCISLYKFHDEVISQLKNLSFSEEQIVTFNEISTALSDFSFDWKDIECTFDWNRNLPYIERMSRWIDEQDKSVMDFGAGECVLKKFLRSDIKYIPLDYIARTPEFVAYDFNKDPFPDLKADVMFLSYCLPYVEEDKLMYLLNNVFTSAQRKVIVSFVIAKKGDTGNSFKKFPGTKTIFYSIDIVDEVAKKHGFILKDSFEIIGEPGLPIDRQHLLFIR